MNKEREETMFYSLTGRVAHTEPGLAVIDVGGVAFKCFTSMNTLRNLPRLGENATLYTHLNVREDALDLFGFLTQGELNCFKLLTGISGVGPKVGIAILSELTPENVALAAAAGDSKRFTKASGVGPKLAQRIVLELKDKVKSLSASGLNMEELQAGGPSASGSAAQAVEALVTLGYSPSDAAAAVGRLDSALPPEELIRLALKSFGSR
nr:Holliday junction branch migration protein RuvA [Neglectibacter sp. M00184]